MFAQRLKELRKESGLTQTQFAQQFNVSSGAVGMWETGKREPDIDTINRLARFFHVSADYLLGNVSEPHFYLDNERSKNELNSCEDDIEKTPIPKNGRRWKDFVNGDQELTEYLEMLRDRPECRMLFSISKDASKEDVEKAVAIIETLRNMEGRG